MQYNFGEWLKAARLKRGLTVGDLAEKAIADQGTISRIENHKAEPTLPTVIRISRALDAKYMDLVVSLGFHVRDEFNLENKTETNPDSLSYSELETLINIEGEPDLENYIQVWSARILGLPKYTLHELPIPNEIPEFDEGHFKYPGDIPVDFLLSLFKNNAFIIYHDVGNYLRKFRQAKGLSSQILEKNIGISDTALLRIERGEVASLKLNHLLLLDDFLKDRGLFIGSLWKATFFMQKIRENFWWFDGNNSLYLPRPVYELIAIERYLHSSTEHQIFIKGLRSYLNRPGGLKPRRF